MSTNSLRDSIFREQFELMQETGMFSRYDKKSAQWLYWIDNLPNVCWVVDEYGGTWVPGYFTEAELLVALARPTSPPRQLMEEYPEGTGNHAPDGMQAHGQKFGMEAQPTTPPGDPGASTSAAGSQTLRSNQEGGSTPVEPPWRKKPRTLKGAHTI